MAWEGNLACSKGRWTMATPGGPHPLTSPSVKLARAPHPRGRVALGQGRAGALCFSSLPPGLAQDFAEGVPDVHQPTLERLVDRACRLPAGPEHVLQRPQHLPVNTSSNVRVGPSRNFGCFAMECRAWMVMARMLLRRTFSSILALTPTIYSSDSISSRLLSTPI